MRSWTAWVALAAILAASCSDEDIGPAADATVSSSDARVVTEGGSSPPDAAVGPEAGRPEVGVASVAPDAAARVSPDAAASIPRDAAASAPADVARDLAPVPPDTAPGFMLVGRAGGSFPLNEGKLLIRPGALSKDTEIAFRTVSSGYPALPGNRAFSSVFALEPHGQTFTEPVTLTIYHFGGAAKVGLYTASPGGAFTLVDSAAITFNTAEANLQHFSYFVVAPLVAARDAGQDLALPPPDDAGVTVTVDAAVSDAAADAATSQGPDTATTADAAPDGSPAPDLSEPTGPQTAIVEVRGEGAGFSPKIAVVKKGDSVTWFWATTGTNHTVISGGGGGPGDCASDGKFSSGVQGPGADFSVTFTTPGTYAYHCAAHCVQFEGGVIVVQP